MKWGYSSSVSMVICGIRRRVQSRCRAMSPCLSGRCHFNHWVGRVGHREIWGRKGRRGGGVVVIICAYEEGGSSLVASSRQLLWSSCLWGEVAETRVCSPETRGKVAPQGIQQHSLFTHHKCKSLLKMELEEMITRLAIWHKHNWTVLIIVWVICQVSGLYLLLFCFISFFFFTYQKSKLYTGTTETC